MEEPMRVAAAMLFGFVVGTGPVAVQAAQQAWRAASITRLHAFSPRSGIDVTAGRFTMENMPLTALIGFAYEGEHDEMRGAPSWLIRDRYSISVLTEAGAQREEVTAQVRLLLHDSLGLEAHVELE